MESYVRELAYALAECGQGVTIATRFVEERPGGGTRGLLSTVADSRHYSEHGGDVEVHVLGVHGWLRTSMLYPAYRMHFYASTALVAIRLFEEAYRPALEAALHGVDVVHYSGTGRELLGFAAARYARRYNLPFFVTPHVHIGTWGDSPLDLRLYQQADKVIALTEVEREHLVRQGVDGSRIRVIGHGVSVSGRGEGAKIRQRLKISGLMVLYLGRKSESKGYALFLESMSKVWESVPEVHFVMAGPDHEGWTAEARVRYKAVMDDPRVHELGYVSDAERDDLFDAADVFCLPSAAEAYGLVYLEAWAYGTPVVACAIPTLEELIGQAEAGVLVERNPTSIADALVQLLLDEAGRQRMGQAGASQVRGRTWTRVAEELIPWYETVERTGGEVVPVSNA